MNIQNLRNRTKIRNLTIFIILVLASGWLGRGLDVLIGNPRRKLWYAIVDY